MKVDKLLAWLKEHVRRYIREVMDRKTSAHSIALGFAVGTFIAIIPTPGFGAFLGFVSVVLIKNINKVSVFFGLAVWNYVTLAPLYVLSFKIGDLLFEDAAMVKYKFEILHQMYSFSRRFLVGNVILAVVISVASYVVVNVIVEVYRKRG